MTGDKLMFDIGKALGLPNVDIVRSADVKFGDFSTNVALKATRNSKPALPAGRQETRNPLEIAKGIADAISKIESVEKAEVAGPGFVNIWMKKSYWQAQLQNVLSTDKKYGSNDWGKGKKARVEFVSANPTGPLHFGNARGGPIGDTIARVLEFSGYKVLREYIDNDRGNQVWELGKTLAVGAGLVQVKEEELTYKGEYTADLAKRVKNEIGNASNKSEDEIIKAFGEAGVKVQFEEIIADCRAMGIDFDLIVHESDLQAKAKSYIDKLDRRGLVKKADGAFWFAPKGEFLGDSNAVIIKSDGNYTYFTADVVYHSEKFESGYDLVVDVFGSNTIGHVPKLKALASVLGFNLENFKVILYQFVRIKRGSDIVNMSKRAGNFVTAAEVLDEVGRDAFRFFILMHDSNTHMDFDLELAREKSNKNPVFYVQYAHARTASILEKQETGNLKQETNYELLKTDYELNLIKQITRLPGLVEDISKSFAVHQLTTYSTELADSFHKFYENCKVISEEEELTAARIGLVKSTQIVLANTLGLLGVSAPEKM